MKRIFGLMITLTACAVALAVTVSGAAAQSDPLPDLIISAIILEPENPKPLEVFTVNATVENVGTASAGPFRVTLTVVSTLSKPVEGLAPGETATVRFSWFGPEGAHTLRVEANPFGDIEEADLDNNALERTVALAPDPLPDLIVADVRLNPEAPLPGEPTTIGITVENAGTLAPTSRAVLRVKDDLGTLATLFVDELAPGQRETFSVAWRPIEGERRLNVEVDALERVEELDEKNNVFSRLITISPLRPTGANLVVGGLALAPETAASGQPVTLTATVTNVGQGVAEGFSVTFQAGGTLVAAVPIEVLTPGASQRVTATWVPEADGEWAIRVKADSEGTLIETDEDDNVANEFVQVGDPINACGQQVWVRLEDEAAEILANTLALSVEEIQHVFMPKLKIALEDDFAGVNIRFFLNRPVGLHSQLRFVSEPPQDSRLGQAPLDFDNRSKGDTGVVFVVGFEDGLSRGQAFDRSLDSLAQALAKVASHEAGHFLGLSHDSERVDEQFGGQNIMSANVDTVTGSLFSDAFFTEENLVYLKETLPLSCGP